MRLGISLAMRRRHMLQRSGRKSAKRSSDYFLNAVVMCCLGAALWSAGAQTATAQDSAAQATQASPTSTPPGEPTYKPKFPGDPARSDSEAAALGYMRVVLRAQSQFNRQYDHFAT